MLKESCLVRTSGAKKLQTFFKQLTVQSKTERQSDNLNTNFNKNTRVIKSVNTNLPFPVTWCLALKATRWA